MLVGIPRNETRKKSDSAKRLYYKHGYGAPSEMYEHSSKSLRRATNASFMRKLDLQYSAYIGPNTLPFNNR